MNCDCHVHVVGPLAGYPQVASRTYIAGVAPVETLKRNGAARGIGRFVIVQPSFYGDDNAATLDALDALGGDGRGVAVINPAAVTEPMLEEYHRRGVRGLRINLYSPIKSPGGDSLDAAFAATAAVARQMKWHVQVIAPLPLLLDNMDVLAQAPVPVVIDHYGLYGQSRPQSAEGERLIDLLRRPHVWMKLSAPYRLADGPMSTKPDREWLAALVAAAPGRCVWGSDWPHPPAHDQHKGADIEAPYRPLSYNELVDEFLDALPASNLAERIMRDNPARLYEF